MGKTTTCLRIAQAYPKKNILLLTYNTKLKEETRERAYGNDIKNLSVFTYHGYCNTYYNGRAKSLLDDRKLIQITKSDAKAFVEFDLIIIDEAQDMNEHLFDFVSLKILAMNTSDQLCIFGDQRQNLYKFLGSSNRYIKNPQNYFISSKPWKRVTLSTSFRVTTVSIFIFIHIASFICFSLSHSYFF